MKGAEAAEVVGDLASQQWGLVTTAQATACGVDLQSLRRLVTRGVLTRVRHGVYATTGTSPSAVLEVKAHWLALRPELMAAERTGDPYLAAEAVVSHTTAAEMWGIGDLWPDGAHFTVRSRRRSRQSGVRFHRADLGDDDWMLHPVSGLPVTTAARTITNLADEGHEPGYLLDLVADAAGASLVEKWELLEALTGKEEAFDLPAGDAAGLEDVLGEYFPAPELDGRMRAAIDEAVRPLREQIDTLMRSLAPRVTVGEDVAKMVAGTALPPGFTAALQEKIAAGKGATPLDLIRPTEWEDEWNDELLDLLRILTRTVELGVQQIQLLEEIVQSELITTEQLPSPTDAERKVPKTIKRGYGQTSLTF